MSVKQMAVRKHICWLQEEEERYRGELGVQVEEAHSHAEGGDGDTEDEADEFEDKRWRRIRLEPRGGDWYERCRKVTQQLECSSDRTGLTLLQEGG